MARFPIFRYRSWKCFELIPPSCVESHSLQFIKEIRFSFKSQFFKEKPNTRFFLGIKWLYVIVITFYSPSCLGQEVAKDLSVFESSCHLPTCLPHTVELHTVLLIAERPAGIALNSNFYSLWLDPIGNRTRLYSFSSRRSIHSTTYRFMLVVFCNPFYNLKQLNC